MKLQLKKLAEGQLECLSNIKRMGNLKKEIKSEITESFTAYNNAKDEIDIIYPCETEEHEIRAQTR
jgi:hypothetical protein